MNYYKIFQIEESPQVDKESLKEMYQKLQMEYHPDLVEINDNLDKNISSSEINNGFKILSDDFSCLQYYLKIKGENMDNAIIDPDFLEYILEIQEEIERLSQREDLAEIRIKKAEEFTKEIKAAQEYAYGNNLKSSAKHLSKSKYLKRVLDLIDDKISN